MGLWMSQGRMSLQHPKGASLDLPFPNIAIQEAIHKVVGQV